MQSIVDLPFLSAQTSSQSALERDCLELRSRVEETTPGASGANVLGCIGTITQEAAAMHATARALPRTDPMAALLEVCTTVFASNNGRLDAVEAHLEQYGYARPEGAAAPVVAAAAAPEPSPGTPAAVPLRSYFCRPCPRLPLHWLYAYLSHPVVPCQPRVPTVDQSAEALDDTGFDLVLSLRREGTFTQGKEGSDYLFPRRLAADRPPPPPQTPAQKMPSPPPFSRRRVLAEEDETEDHTKDNLEPRDGEPRSLGDEPAAAAPAPYNDCDINLIHLSSLATHRSRIHSAAPRGLNHAAGASC